MGNEVKWVRVDSGERPEVPKGEDSVAVMIYDNDARMDVVEYYADDDTFHALEYEVDQMYFTHWAHLPEPPERGE